jgi:ferric-dicitrate binding protein FerR (iron transport regulator)
MKHGNYEQDLRSEQALEELLGKAQPRPLPPAQDEELIRQAVRAEWDQVTNRRVRTRRMTNFALAASVLLAVFASLYALRGPFDDNQLHQLASIEKQFGVITMLNDGQAVETGAGSGLTLAWNDGGSLRLDENTRVEFESEADIYLHSGRIYFDSMPSNVPTVIADPDKPKLTIRTDAGMVKHYGTQFITQTNGNELNVLVREGRVSVEGTHVNEIATVGQKLTVTRSGQTTVHDVDVTGGDWQWIEKTSPSFTLDNRPIIEFLTWVSRETGNSLKFESPAAETVAREKGLYGVADMEPSRALRIYMQTTALDWRIEDGVIIIRSGGT